MSKSDKSMEVKVLSTETEGEKTCVKIEVPSCEALQAYKLPKEKIIIVSAAKSLPEKGVEMIRAFCFLKGYTYVEAAATADGASSEASTGPEENKQE